MIHKTQKAPPMLAHTHRYKVSTALPTLKEALAKLESRDRKHISATAAPAPSSATCIYSKTEVNRAKDVLKRLLSREVSYIQHPAIVNEGN